MTRQRKDTQEIIDEWENEATRVSQMFINLQRRKVIGLFPSLVIGTDLVGRVTGTTGYCKYNPQISEIPSIVVKPVYTNYPDVNKFLVEWKEYWDYREKRRKQRKSCPNCQISTREAKERGFSRREYCYDHRSFDPPKEFEKNHLFEVVGKFLFELNPISFRYSSPEEFQPIILKDFKVGREGREEYHQMRLHLGEKKAYDHYGYNEYEGKVLFLEKGCRVLVAEALSKDDKERYQEAINSPTHIKNSDLLMQILKRYEGQVFRRMNLGG